MRSNREAVGVTWASLAINVALGAIKGGVGLIAGSMALVADALHSLLDLLSDAAVLFGLKIAARPEDANHPYGHHKFSSMARLAVGAVLLGFSVSLVAAAFTAFREGEARPPGGWAAAIAVAGLAVKEALYRWTRAVARRTRSDLLLSNALHHRADSVSSLGVSVALVAVWLGGPEWAILDPAVSLVLAVFLIREGGRIVRRATGDLLDTAPEREIIEDFREHILPTPGARAYHDFRVRRLGDMFEVDLHLQVDPDLSVEDGHAVARRVKTRIMEMHPEVFRVLVHIEPATRPHLHERGVSGAAPERSTRDPEAGESIP